MNRCGDCKHWGTQEEAAEGQRFRVCQAIQHSGCNASQPGFAGRHMTKYHPEERAGTMDGSDYHSAIVSRDDFGCVLFEPAISTPAPDAPPG